MSPSGSTQSEDDEDGGSPGSASTGAASSASVAAWAGPALRYGCCERQGTRPTHEDASLAFPCLSPDAAPWASRHDPPAALFGVRAWRPVGWRRARRSRGKRASAPAGRLTRPASQVFDGHGGAAAAKYAAASLLPALRAAEGALRSPGDAGPPPPPPTPEARLARAFAAVDEGLRAGACGGTCGTTALVALVLGRTLFVAHAGDCRAVLWSNGRVTQLTHDHKPHCSAESRRIAALGGHVDEEGYLGGCLSVSRSLGDWDLSGRDPKGSRSLLKPGPLSGVPEVCSRTLTPADDFLVLACDGLWDVLSNGRCCELVRASLKGGNDPGAAAAALCCEALRLGSTDNVSALCVTFSASPFSPASSSAGGGGCGQRGGAPLSGGGGSGGVGPKSTVKASLSAASLSLLQTSISVAETQAPPLQQARNGAAGGCAPAVAEDVSLPRSCGAAQ